MKLKNKEQIIDWLGKGDLDSALKELKLQLKTNKRAGTDLLKTATSLSAQLEKVKSDKLKGIITYEQETLAMNKLLDKVQVFVEKVDNQEVEPKVAKAPPVKVPIATSTEKSSSASWWLLLTVLAGIGLWYFVLREKPIEADIRICTLKQISNEHWCEEPLPRVSLQEANSTLYVTAIFFGGFEADDLVEGTVKDSNQGIFATQRIVLTMNQGDLAHSAMIQPSVGNQWVPGNYKIILTVNGEEVGEHPFVIF